MEPQIYFTNESPDFNLFIEKGRMERIAANRVVICVMTEFGLVNDRRMNAKEFSSFMETQQMTVGRFNEKKEDIKDVHNRKKKYIIKAIESIRPLRLTDTSTGDVPIESMI